MRVTASPACKSGDSQIRKHTASSSPTTITTTLPLSPTMSDSGSYSGSPEPAPKPTRKRKSDAAAPAASKKARASAPNGSSVSNPAAQALVTSVLANAASYTDASNPQALGNALVSLAAYARELETAIASSAAAGPSAPPAKTPEQVQEAAAKLRKAAVSGIKKQMKVCGYTILYAAHAKSNSHPVAPELQNGWCKMGLRRRLL